MTYEQEILARAMNHIDDDMILAAHAPRKKVRRIIPTLVAACLVVAVALSFPYLRTVINVSTDLFAPNDAPNQENAIVQDPAASSLREQNMPVTLGGTTLTLTATTETTATFTVVKTDDIPVYAMLYDRRQNALASTEPNYKDGGITIRPNTIRLYVNRAEQPVYRFPTAPGTYEVTVDFATIRNGTYPMREYIGLYAYIGEDDEPIIEYFSLKVLTETDTVDPETSADTAEPVSE